MEDKTFLKQKIRIGIIFILFKFFRRVWLKLI